MSRWTMLTIAQALAMERRARALWAGGERIRATATIRCALTHLPTTSTSSRVSCCRAALLLTIAGWASERGDSAAAASYAWAAHRTAALADDAPERVRRWKIEALIVAGNSHRLLAEYEHAGQCFKEARSLTSDQLTLAGLLNAEGILAKDRHLWNDAQEHYLAALRILTQQLGVEHPTLASVHHNLAGLAIATGNPCEGAHEARQAVHLRQKAKPADAAALASDWSVLAAALTDLRAFDEAETLLCGALGYWTRQYGRQHYEVSVQLSLLAAIQAARGNAVAAEGTLTEALRIRRATRGPGHPETHKLEVRLFRLATVGGSSRDPGGPSPFAEVREDAL